MTIEAYKALSEAGYSGYTIEQVSETVLRLSDNGSQEGVLLDFDNSFILVGNTTFRLNRLVNMALIIAKAYGENTLEWRIR